jgi:DNA-binding NarL/FixJ family response regulator
MEGYSTFPEIVPSQLPFSVSFNEREMKVLRFFCKGKTRREIAGELGVSEALVKVIVTTLLNKTGFDSILRLAVYLTSSGYIMPGIEE